MNGCVRNAAVLIVNKRQRLRWLSDVVQVEESTPALIVEPTGGSRGNGRIPLSQEDQVKKDMTAICKAVNGGAEK